MDVVAVWALDGYSHRRLESAARSGKLARSLERHRPSVEIGSTPFWGFDAARLGAREGWAVPVSSEGARPGSRGLRLDLGGRSDTRA
jgi:hypothetical protein